MFNFHIIVGRAGRDPEILTASNGLTLAKLSVATFRKFHDKAAQETKEETTWHNVVFFGKLAEVCERIVKKGSVVLIAGRHNNKKVDSNEGTKTYPEIVANELQVIQWPEDSKKSHPKKRQSKFGNDDVPF